MDPEMVSRKQKEGLTLLDFAAEIYAMQLGGKRHFLHEPLGRQHFQLAGPQNCGLPTKG